MIMYGPIRNVVDGWPAWDAGSGWRNGVAAQIFKRVVAADATRADDPLVAVAVGGMVGKMKSHAGAWPSPR
jgi:hypothetical protein